MLLQKGQIGKTAVILILIILLATLATMPLFLQADTTGEATSEANLFLPVVYNEDNGTPTPIATATMCPLATQEIFIIDPVTTPTSELSQTLVVRLGHGEWVRATGPGGTVTVTSPDPDGFFRVTVPLAANATNDILVEGKVALVGTPGETCVYGGYIMSRTVTIVQESDTATATPTPTSTPVEPYIVAIPDCAPGPNIEFNLQGANWPTDQTLTLFWQGNAMAVFQANQHPGFFSMTWTLAGLSNGIYTVSALSGTNGVTASDQIFIPCGITPTSTPAPADLIVGQPQLISTPPIIVYEPVAFQVPVTNTGDIAINDLFFVDLLFDPTPVHHSDVYAAVSGLDGNSSITLTITSTIGFANFVGTHQVTGWVDSLDHIVEADETNNLSVSLGVPIANYGGTPTNTPVPNGTATISGVALVVLDNTSPQERMLVSAIDESSGLTVATTYSDENGFYEFDNLNEGTSYTVTACMTIDNNEYFGIRTNREAPDAFADIYANESSCQ